MIEEENNIHNEQKSVNTIIFEHKEFNFEKAQKQKKVRWFRKKDESNQKQIDFKNAIIDKNDECLKQAIKTRDVSD